MTTRSLPPNLIAWGSIPLTLAVMIVVPTAVFECALLIGRLVRPLLEQTQ